MIDVKLARAIIQSQLILSSFLIPSFLVPDTLCGNDLLWPLVHVYQLSMATKSTWTRRSVCERSHWTRPHPLTFCKTFCISTLCLGLHLCTIKQERQNFILEATSYITLAYSSQDSAHSPDVLAHALTEITHG